MQVVAEGLTDPNPMQVVAEGLVGHRNAYLWSGWNWLDGLVVAISLIDIASSGDGPGFGCSEIRGCNGFEGPIR